jgi:GMP synthase (glutamine-hydrolysing)
MIMEQDIHAHKILILDFGSQYTQLIARRVREMGVYCELHPWDWPSDKIKAFNPKGVILSGGPESVTAEETPRVPTVVLESDWPILGICYGMQALAMQMGGEVASSQKREFGHAVLRKECDAALFEGVFDQGNELSVWMSHGDKVASLPESFACIASTDNAPFAAMQHQEKSWFGLQFHPEVTHTTGGAQILRNFVFGICGCEHLWDMEHIIEDQIERVREMVGDEHVLLGLSGGVDSSVVAALLHKAIGDQLTCVFVDNGLLRKNEAKQVQETFAEHMGVRVVFVDASEQFLSNLAGVTDPEQKRKIIGNTFVDVFEAESTQLPGVKWLAQGTIYPDVIESAGAATGKAHVIKSHHNVGGLPEHMKLKLLEPLRELFKDEVRQMGLVLGLPETMVFRHPFPGPGLGVRILGEVKPHYADTLREADDIFISELRTAGLYEKVSQAFTVFLPVKSVGVVGDARQYEYVVSLRAVETIDFMTARWAHLPYDFLELVSNRIINEVPGISRVTYDISSKPPATIEWE